MKTPKGTPQKEDTDAILYSTEIPGLDNHLKGGIPLNGTTILIKGRPSTGKTMFMCQMTAETSKKGQKTLIVTLEMSEEELTKQILSLNGNEEKLKENVKILTIPINEYLNNNEDLGKISIISEIEEALKGFPATNIFIDSLTTIVLNRELFLLPISQKGKKGKKDLKFDIAFQSAKNDDRLIYWLIKSFKRFDKQRIFFLGADKDEKFGMEIPYFGIFEYAVDWVIGFYREHFRNDVSRCLIVEKSRMKNVSGAEKTFRIIPGIGIIVHDFSYDTGPRYEKEVKLLPYGIPMLDEALGGGQLYPGLSMIIGPPGVGKTVLALISSYHRVNHGKKVLYLSFEQSEGDLRLQAYRLGFEFLSTENTNSIHFHYMDLSELNDKILAKIARLVKSFTPDILVIDSLTDIESNIPMSELSEEGGLKEGNTVDEAKKRWVYAFTSKLKNFSRENKFGVLFIKSEQQDSNDADTDKIIEDADVVFSLSWRWKKVRLTKYDLSLSIIKSRYSGIKRKYRTLACRILPDRKGFDFPSFFNKNHFETITKIVPETQITKELGKTSSIIDNAEDKNIFGMPAKTSSLVTEDKFNQKYQT